MEYKDYYQTLGIARDASAAEIKKAFRKLARKYHPDISREPDAEARMKAVNEAHAVLSDPDKRAAYDRLGRGWRPGQEFRPPPGWDAGRAFTGHGFSPGEAGFSDFFDELFGGLGGAGPIRPQGEDLHARVLIDLEDAYTGASRQLSLTVPGPDARGRPAAQTRTLKVKIPRGVRPGQVIRLAGQGAPGIAGGAPGDLMLEVAFRPHPLFRVEGRDLRMTLPVAPWEAALGAVIPLRLPEGTIKLRVPAGIQGGGPLRVRGKGLPGEPPGDLLLDVQVVAPPADTPRARELYEAMARELAFNPRGRG